MPVPGNGEEPARRCDILLVRVTQRSLRIECVEVKGRRTAQLPIALADDIVDQLEHTERVLQRQFFSNDPPRLDVGLQRTRLAGLLHYYAERSARTASSQTSGSSSCTATSTGSRSRSNRPRSRRPGTSSAPKVPVVSPPGTAKSRSRCLPPPISAKPASPRSARRPAVPHQEEDGRHGPSGGSGSSPASDQLP